MISEKHTNFQKQPEDIQLAWVEFRLKQFAVNQNPQSK